MTNMDRSLNQEIKRRIEYTASLETKCSEEIAAMEERLTAIIDSQVETITDRLNVVEKKVEELNSRLEEERTKIPLDIEPPEEQISRPNYMAAL